LLVLDNFEQLVEAGGPAVVVDLLERLPRLRCLVTSRRVMNIAGEREVALGTLPLPEASMLIADVANAPSVALFIDRARGARPDLGLTARNRAALIQLSRALERLPLAIEIAASHIRAFSPEEMCAALAERFDLLKRRGQRAQRHGRHASLQMTVEWSWQLLTPAQ
jgi:predicted ATPase